MTSDLFLLQVCEFLDNGDGVYRFHEPSRALSHFPGVVVVDCDLNHRFFPRLAREADVVLFQGFDWDLFPLVEERRAAGKATVLEANDYYPDVQPWNPRAPMWLDRGTQEELRQCMGTVDAVQASTAELARRWQPWAKKVIVFPNQLADVPPLKERPARPLTIGWGGSTGHYADWYFIAPILQRWLTAHPEVHLSLMADEFVYSFMDLPRERYHRLPPGTLADYLRFVEGLDIGLAPLLPTDFNRCRSDVKFLEYASRGIAGVYADLDPYRQTVVDGRTGLLYRTPEEFVVELERLVTDLALRQAIRQKAYDYVATQRRLSDHVGERLEFYRTLLTRRAQGVSLPDEILAAGVRDGNYLKLRPGPPDETLAELGKATPSRETVQKLSGVVEQFPHYLAALDQLGKQLNDLREPRQALPYLERALTLYPKSARVICEIGRSWFLVGDVQAARKHLEAGLTLNPFFQRGWTYFFRLLQPTRAPDGPEWARRARQTHPDNLFLALAGVRLFPPAEAVGLLHRYLDEFEPTLTTEERPAAAVGFSQAVFETVGPVLGEAGTLAMLRRVGDAFPQSARLAEFLGQALQLAGQPAEARRHRARALELRRLAESFGGEFTKGDGPHPLWQIAEHLHRL